MEVSYDFYMLATYRDRQSEEQTDAWIYVEYVECQAPTGAVKLIHVLPYLGCGLVIKLWVNSYKMTQQASCTHWWDCH